MKTQTELDAMSADLDRREALAQAKLETLLDDTAALIAEFNPRLAPVWRKAMPSRRVQLSLAFAAGFPEGVNHKTAKFVIGMAELDQK